MKTYIPCTLGILAFVVSSVAYSDEARDIESKLDARCAHHTEDHRSRDIGCSGNTFEANVCLDEPSASISGTEAKITVKYSGGYKREKFARPCVRTATERKKVHGKYTFTLQSRGAFGGVEVKDGSFSDLGEVSDGNHDSNRMAKLAVQNAVNEAFGQ